MIGPNATVRRYTARGLANATVAHLGAAVITPESSDGVSPGASDGSGGNAGTSPINGVLTLGILRLAQATSALTLDASAANTLEVTLRSSVTSVRFTRFPSTGRTERVTVYLRQDATGGRTVTGWAQNVKWEGGVAPVIAPGANSVSCLVFDSTDGGATVYGNVIALGYA